MNQTNTSELPVDEQTNSKKNIWISPEFTILSSDIIKGVGDAGPDFNFQQIS